MKRLLIIFTVISTILMVTVIPAQGAVTPGTKCAKAGTKQVFKGKTYTCIKLGKLLYWNNGVLIATPAPTVTVTATPAPTVTVTATPVPKVTVAPTPAPTVTVAPTPAPTVSKPLIPTSIKATIKFSGGATTRTAWGTGLSNLYCDIPQDAIINPVIPNYTVATVNWSQTNMKLFDGVGKLLGIASSLPQYQHFTDGSCSVTFVLNDLVLSQGPLTFRTGSAPNWTVAYSDWMDGEVFLSGDSTVIRF